VNDLALGTFSDDGPWEVELDRLSWLPGLDHVRATVRAEVPRLVKPKKLPPGGRMVATARHLGVGVALWAGGKRRRGGVESITDLSRRLRQAAERLGPAYIKLGQIISAGEGVFPEPLVAEFKKCRDQVPPETWETVRRVVEEDLGQPLEAVFSSFDHEPLAAASIAQVHAATLRTGEQVVVKVQRPQVNRLVKEDLAVMAWIAPRLVGRIPVAALANPPALVELFAETIAEELDFRLEAENMLDVARSLVELNQKAFVVPRPHPDLVTRRVLVMERLAGFAYDDVTGMQAAGLDTAALVRAGMIGFLEGAMLCGIFHGDLHGGNLMVLPDGLRTPGPSPAGDLHPPSGTGPGVRTALLDFGITGRLDEFRRRAFLRLLVGATVNDVKGQMAALRDLGTLPPDTDLDAVIADLGLDRPPVDPTTLTPDELVAEIQRTVKGLLGYGARMPKELMLFVKNLVFLDGAIANLAPDLDLFGEIAHIATHFAVAHGARITADVGVDPRTQMIDLSGVKASFGVDAGLETLTYRDLQERRAIIRERLAKRDRKRRRP
jgi:ubiquinone biosynthesis protein